MYFALDYLGVRLTFKLQDETSHGYEYEALSQSSYGCDSDF